MYKLFQHQQKQKPTHKQNCTVKKREEEPAREKATHLKYLGTVWDDLLGVEDNTNRRKNIQCCD